MIGWMAFRRSMFFVVILTALLAACGAQQGDPAQAVIDYLNALISKDAQKAASLSCAQWEADSQMEVDSFQAVSATLEGVTCTVSGDQSDQKLVSCSGKIVISYNGETREINLADRTYRTVLEGGDWRVCGYQ
jgi:hypothetical protein